VRLMWKMGEVAGGYLEYGTFSLYGTEILLLVLVVLNLVRIGGDRGDKGNKGDRGFLRYFIVLFFVVSCLSIFWATDSDLALYKFGVLLEGFLFFWLIFSSGVGRKKIAWMIVLSGGLQAGLGVWQFLAQHVAGNKWLGMATQWPMDNGVSVVGTELRRWLRAYGSLPHPNILGGWLVIGLILCVGLYESVYGTLVAKWGSQETKRGFSAMVLMLFFVVMFSGLLTTFSRGAWIAFFVSLLIYWFINLLKKDKLGSVVGAKFLIIAVLITVMFGLAFREPFLARVKGEGRLETKSIEQRKGAYREAKEVITKNWLRGAGLGNYTLYLYDADLRTIFDSAGMEGYMGLSKEGGIAEKNAWDYQPVHNVWLLVWGEIGILGVILFGLIFLFIALKALKAGKRLPAYGLVMLVIFILSLFDHYFWSFYFGVMVWWLVLGLSILSTSSRPSGKDEV